MEKPISSLSGVEMTASDADRALMIIADTQARALMSAAADMKVVGSENAKLIRDALSQQGFAITHSDQSSLREAIARIIELYDMRKDLYVSDAELAASMAMMAVRGLAEFDANAARSSDVRDSMVRARA